jgi:hypothetical protein
MALTSGTLHSVHIVKAPGSVDGLGLALVLFTLSGTYDTSLDSDLKTVATHIQNAVQNGKTVTMRAVAEGQHTYRADTGLAIGIKTAAISTNDVTFTLTKSTTTAYGTTEFDNSTAIPTLTGVLGIYVVYTEA